MIMKFFVAALAVTMSLAFAADSWAGGRGNGENSSPAADSDADITDSGIGNDPDGQASIGDSQKNPNGSIQGRGFWSRDDDIISDPAGSDGTNSAGDI